MNKTPIKFTYKLKVKEDDLDELNHVNNVIFLRYIQEAAISHWYSIASEILKNDIRWVVRKHEIEYFKQAYLNDELTIITWVDNFSGISSDRQYEIYREHELLVKARTLWVALDTETLKPKRLSEEISNGFYE
jgi:acyl-CoA thioester hydrolase